MQISPVVSIYHDCRRELKNTGKFPVRIRVYFAKEDEAKYVKTGISFNKEDYDKAISPGDESKVPKAPRYLRQNREKVYSVFNAVKELIKPHKFLNPASFQSLVKGKTVSKVDDNFPVTLDVEKLFKHFIELYTVSEQIGTKKVYNDAMNSILSFGGPGLTIDKIDKAWLEAYEVWAQKPKKREVKGYWRGEKFVKYPEGSTVPGCSLTTIGMYLRCVKHVYNEVIDPKRRILPIESYPFSSAFNKDGYTIRSEETVKNVVDEKSRVQIVSDQKMTFEESRDLKYWLFSYYCLGINFTDMAYLGDAEIRENEIVYVRRKTMRNVKVVKPIIVPLRPEAKAILQELGTHRPYAFGIITDKMTAEEQKHKIELWYKRVNKNMKKIAVRNGIKGDVGSYGARHAVGKRFIDKGVHLQHIQEMYGHTKVQTTQRYTSGMNTDQLKGFSDLL